MVGRGVTDIQAITSVLILGKIWVLNLNSSKSCSKAGNKVLE